MASRFNTLLHGEIDDVLTELGDSQPLDDIGVRAALTNAFTKIGHLVKANDANARQFATRLAKLENNQ